MGISKQPSHLFPLLSDNTNMDPSDSHVFWKFEMDRAAEATLVKGPCGGGRSMKSASEVT